MSGGSFGYGPYDMDVCAQYIGELLRDDFRYHDDCEGLTVDRLQGLTPDDREDFLIEAGTLMVLLVNVKRRLKELDYMLAQDTGPAECLKVWRYLSTKKMLELKLNENGDLEKGHSSPE